MRELSFVVDAIMQLVVGAFLLRLICQLVRADFRNPFVQAIVRLTNPLIMPLRRVLPPVGRVDTASVLAVVLAQLLRTVLAELIAFGRLGSLGVLAVVSVVQVLDMALVVLLLAVILYVVMSWVAPDRYNPASRLLDSLVEPLLRPFRRAIPPIGGLDLSAIAVSILLVVLRMILNDRVLPALLSLH